MSGEAVGLLLKVENITKSFGGLKAVKNVSFHVRRNEIVGLIGPNGAGKTTLFNCVTGFIKPDTGKVLLKDVNVGRMEPNNIAKLGMARTFQIVQPFGRMTTEENVCVGALLKEGSVEKAMAIAREKLAIVGLQDFNQVAAASLPMGHRKRLEMARVLATGAELLLLDEVMGGLNHTEIKEMVDIIRRLQETGVTILIIEHHMQAIMALSDRVITIHRGEKIAEGSPEEISTNPLVMEAYFGGELNLA